MNTASNVRVSRWGEHGARPTPLAKNADLFASMVVRAAVDVACSTAQAWALVTDVGRIGEFSPECVGATWAPPRRGACVGARFEGINHVIADGKELVWIRPCTVTVAHPGRAFGYVVGDRYDGSPASVWLFELSTLSSTRSRIDLTMRHHRDGLSGLRLFADKEASRAPQVVAARAAELASGMQRSLNRMKAVLEGKSSDRR